MIFNGAMHLKRHFNFLHFFCGKSKKMNNNKSNTADNCTNYAEYVTLPTSSVIDNNQFQFAKALLVEYNFIHRFTPRLMELVGFPNTRQEIVEVGGQWSITINAGGAGDGVCIVIGVGGDIKTLHLLLLLFK